MGEKVKLRAVQYHPDYCLEAKLDLERNGISPFFRFDTSHDLSIIDADGVRWYVGSYRHSELATEAGEEIESSGVIPEGAVRK